MIELIAVIESFVHLLTDQQNNIALQTAMLLETVRKKKPVAEVVRSSKLVYFFKP